MVEYCGCAWLALLFGFFVAKKVDRSDDCAGDVEQRLDDADLLTGPCNGLQARDNDVERPADDPSGQVAKEIPFGMPSEFGEVHGALVEEHATNAPEVPTDSDDCVSEEPEDTPRPLVPRVFDTEEHGEGAWPRGGGNIASDQRE